MVAEYGPNLGNYYKPFGTPVYLRAQKDLQEGTNLVDDPELTKKWNKAIHYNKHCCSVLT